MDNLQYLYNHLPTRFRRDDKELFLKRYLQFFGETLDDYDEKFDTFFENIDPETADETWIEFWLRELFGWSWFPTWFTLVEKRRLYSHFAAHLARRGTAKGIEQWLADFNISARVYTRPVFWGNMVWGEDVVSVPDPLLLKIEILNAEPNFLTDISSVGDACWGEFFYSGYESLFTNRELMGLLRFMQPHAQEFLIGKTVFDDVIPPTVSINPLEENPDGYSGIVTFTAQASDNVGVDRVEWFVDGVWQYTDDLAPYGFSWDTIGFPDGDRTIRAVAYDKAGNASEPDELIVFKNDPIDLAELPNILCYYEAETLTGLADSDPVDSIADHSPSGYDLASSGSARSLYRTGGNGLNNHPVFQFDGVNDKASHASGTNTITATTIGVVYKDLGIALSAFSALLRITANEIWTKDGSNLFRFGIGGVGWTSAFTMPETKGAAVVKINYAANSVEVWVNGAKVFDGALGGMLPTSVNANAFGMAESYDSYFAPVKIACAFATSDLINADDLEKFFADYSRKYNLY